MRHTFFCIDGHTAGNPVRLVAGGAPLLRGGSMAERRQDFLARFDWIRTGLCFEPRGHDMMSGGFLYPPTRDDSDCGILFIETSGCLPMCGHGTIGMVTFALEHGLVTPRTPGRLRIEVPAGVIDVTYRGGENGGAGGGSGGGFRRSENVDDDVSARGALGADRVTSVRIRNVPAYVAATGIAIDVPGFGPLTVDVAYGGNYYAIVEPQGAYTGLDALGAARLVELSRAVRRLVHGAYEPVHPLDDRIRGVSHVLWTDVPKGAGAEAPKGAGSNANADADADGRNAVFYGERAIDRSPCGTGTSARLAHLVAQGKLGVGDSFVHESYIGSRFTGRVDALADVGGLPGIVPSIEGSAIATGFNTIWIDRADPFWAGFTVV